MYKLHTVKQYCTFCEHRSIHQTTPEQSARQYAWTDRLRNTFRVMSATRTCREFIKMLHFEISKLPPDIRVMQSGANCRYESTSDINFGPSRVQKGVRPWVKRLFLDSLAMEPWLYIYIYMYIYIYILYMCDIYVYIYICIGRERERERERERAIYACIYIYTCTCKQAPRLRRRTCLF